jgi:cell filamentation protein
MQPGSHSHVLKNKLGITKKSEMDLIEYEALAAAQRRYLVKISQDTRFDAKLICEMHRDWLDDIYEWAGQYRTVNLTKDGFSWPAAFRVPDNMEHFSKDTLARHTPCHHQQLSAIGHSLAIVHAELLLIHPYEPLEAFFAEALLLGKAEAESR